MKRVGTYFNIKKDAQGKEVVETYVDGLALLRFGINKGTAFSYEERKALHIDGLLPPQVNSLEQQIERAYAFFRSATTPLDKYQALRALQERHEVLYFALLERHLQEMLPIVYTPTVGEAVKQFSSLYQSPRGLSLSPLNIASAESIVANYPMQDIRMIVATDASAILGIGDQGYGGLAIPIGKLALYTVAGGVSPFHTMPVSLDVGTDRSDLVEDPLYLGVRQKRLRGEPYLEFIDSFVEAVRVRCPDAIVQWEDLSKEAAFTVLERYRKTIPSFNDDIQGTGAVALSGVVAACRMKGEALKDQRIVIHGAGAGGVGVAWALWQGLMREGLSEKEAAARIYVLDSKGLLLGDRPMEEYKRPFAQAREAIADWKCGGQVPSLLETIQNAKATVLLGLSGQPRAFGEAEVLAIAKNTAQPVVFPLSNPTSSAEALPDDVIRWTNGNAIVATGSPFEPVNYNGKTHMIGQGNNAFIFPGLGFGALLCHAKEITDNMVLEASYALASYTIERHADRHWVYPPVEELQQVSIRVAASVIKQAIADGVARKMPKQDLESYVHSRFWQPKYLPVVRG